MGSRNTLRACGIDYHELVQLVTAFLGVHTYEEIVLEDELESKCSSLAPLDINPQVNCILCNIEILL